MTTVIRRGIPTSSTFGFRYFIATMTEIRVKYKRCHHVIKIPQPVVLSILWLHTRRVKVFMLEIKFVRELFKIQAHPRYPELEQAGVDK